MAYEIKYRSDNEMKDSGIEWLGMIPKEWSGCKIKHIATLKIGNSISALDKENKYSKVIDNFYPYIATKDINVDIKTIEHGNNLFIPRNTNFEVAKRGTSLICIEGGSAGRKIGYLKEDSCFGNKLCNVEANKKVINRLLYYILQTDHFGVEFFNKTTGIIPGVSIEEFKTINTVLPNGEDQQKIANFLDIKIAEFDSIISKKELLIEKLEEAKKSLISEVVTGKVKIVDGELVEREPEEMKDSGVEWLGTIPKDWEVKKIKHNTYVKGRIGWQGLRADEFTDEGPYLVTGTDFLNKSINWNNCYHISEKRYKEAPAIHLKDGDLLITKDGSIGKLAIVENCPDKAILNSGIFVTRCTNGEYLTEFMFYILSSNIFNIYIGLMTTGSTILHLYQSTFVNFIYPLPNIDIQSKLIQYLDNETNKINSIITKTQKQAKQSLISEAVTGKIDLRDWEII
jgi:type I restriction enzyme S subunit